MKNRYRVVEAKLKGRQVIVVADMTPDDGSRPYVILRNGHHHDPKGIGTGNILTWKSRPGAEMYVEMLNKGSR